jgi:hypothetical protein
MKSHPFHRIIEALLVVPVAICAQSFARAESTEQTVKDEIQVGIEAYQHHDFQTALKYLTLGEHAEPQNALIHYYRANSLASLKQIKKALPEYQAALKLDPKGDVGFYSEQALKNAKQTTASGPLQGTVNAQGFQTYSTPTARSYAQPIPGSAATGVWSPSSGSSAGIQIMQQSRDLSRQVVDAGAINEANIIGSGLSRTAIMRQQMQAQVMRMRNAVAPSLNGGYVHMYSAGEIQAYQQRMQMQINAAMQNESYEASNQHKLLQQQAEAVNQSAANLQSRALCAGPTALKLGRNQSLRALLRGRRLDANGGHGAGFRSGGGASWRTRAGLELIDLTGTGPRLAFSATSTDHKLSVEFRECPIPFGHLRLPSSADPNAASKRVRF